MNNKYTINDTMSISNACNHVVRIDSLAYSNEDYMTCVDDFKKRASRCPDCCTMLEHQKCCVGYICAYPVSNLKEIMEGTGMTDNVPIDYINDDYISNDILLAGIAILPSDRGNGCSNDLMNYFMNKIISFCKHNDIPTKTIYAYGVSSGGNYLLQKFGYSKIRDITSEVALYAYTYRKEDS